jgi:hypothetical protein
MFGYPFILADRDRAEQYALLSSTQKLFHDFEVWQDEHGIVWARKRQGRHCFAVTMLGPNWVFNTHLQQQWADDLACRRGLMESYGADSQFDELSRITKGLHLQHNSERIAWAIHQWVLRTKRSAVDIPDKLLARAIWGSNESARPRNWRKTLGDILQSLAQLHVTVWPDEGDPVLGHESAVLTFTQDMLGSQHDRCDDDCPWFDGPEHSHFRVIIGPGFLGVLDQFAEQVDPSDPRTYEFRVRAPIGEGPTLRTLGRTGRLVSVYLPAKIGDRDACKTLSADQHRLLQLIVRETTRNTTGTLHDMTEAAVFVGNEVQGLHIKEKPIQCPQLEASRKYVGFNGRGGGKGLGYGLITPGGWLSRSGYNSLPKFLADLAALSKQMGLIPVGVRSSNRQCHDLDRLRAFARTPDGCRALAKTHLRIYTPADYVQRWNDFFGWDAELPESEQGPGFRTASLITQMTLKGIMQRQLAQAIGVNEGFIGKVLRGKRRWPVERLKQAQEWVAGYEQPRPTQA